MNESEKLGLRRTPQLYGRIEAIAKVLPCQSCADVSDDSYGLVAPKLCGRIRH